MFLFLISSPVKSNSIRRVDIIDSVLALLSSDLCESLLGFSIGKWQTLQNPEYISVFNTTENITVRVVTAETTNSFPVIVLNLFYERNKKITVYKTEKLKDAFDVASHIADALGIDLLDATVKNDYKWVDKDALREKGEIVYTD